MFSLTWVTDKALEIANPITPADRWSLPSAANRQVKKVIMFPTVSSHKVSHLENEREKRKNMFRVKGGVNHGFIIVSSTDYPRPQDDSETIANKTLPKTKGTDRYSIYSCNIYKQWWQILAQYQIL